MACLVELSQIVPGQSEVNKILNHDIPNIYSMRLNLYYYGIYIYNYITYKFENSLLLFS
jgi:hypothetical protein